MEVQTNTVIVNNTTTTTHSVRPAAIGWRRFVHLHWIRMPMGLLKVVEFAIVLLALAIMGSIRSSYGSDYSSVEFFYFVYSATIIMVIMTIVLYVTNLFHRLPTIMISNMVWTVMCAIGTLMMLISSSVVMSKFQHFDTVLAAGSFGIIAMFLFLFETVFYFIKWRNHGPYATSSVQAIIGFTAAADHVATAEEVSAY